MNPKDQQSRSPSKSIQSSNGSPYRTSVSQDSGSVSSARVPRPGSLASSWDPRVREREKEQERLRRAALRTETEARAREFQRQKVIEIFDHEEVEVDGTDGGATESSFHVREREPTVLTISDSVEPESTSRSESPSLFLPPYVPPVNITSQATQSMRPPKIPDHAVESIDLTHLGTPSPPRQRPSRPTLTTTGGHARPANNATSARGSKRGQDREADDELPPKRPARNTGRAGGVSQGQRRTRPGNEKSETPRERFLAAMKESNAKGSVIEKIMILYDRCH